MGAVCVLTTHGLQHVPLTCSTFSWHMLTRVLCGSDRRARVEGIAQLSSYAEKAVSAKLVAKLESAAKAWHGATPSAHPLRPDYDPLLWSRYIPVMTNFHACHVNEAATSELRSNGGCHTLPCSSGAQAGSTDVPDKSALQELRSSSWLLADDVCVCSVSAATHSNGDVDKLLLELGFGTDVGVGKQQAKKVSTSGSDRPQPLRSNCAMLNCLTFDMAMVQPQSRQ